MATDFGRRFVTRRGRTALRPNCGITELGRWIAFSNMDLKFVTGAPNQGFDPFGNRAPEESAIADFAALNVDTSADPNVASELYVGRYPADAKLHLDSRGRGVSRVTIAAGGSFPDLLKSRSRATWERTTAFC